MTTDNHGFTDDDPKQANAILNYVLDITLLTTEEVQRFATERFEAAPASALHACELAALVAGEAIEWVRRWPK